MFFCLDHHVLNTGMAAFLKVYCGKIKYNDYKNVIPTINASNGYNLKQLLKDEGNLSVIAAIRQLLNNGNFAHLKDGVSTRSLFYCTTDLFSIER
jgi:hypothetical protein